MSERPEDALRVFDKVGRDFGLDRSDATPLMRTFLVLQSRPGTFFETISKRVFRDSPQELDRIRAHEKFSRYHRDDVPAGEASTSRGRRTNRSILRNDREYGSPVWHSLFHFVQMPKAMDPAESGAAVHKQLETLAYFDRDLRHQFGRDVSPSASLPLYCMAQLEPRNLSQILSGWSDDNVSRGRAEEVAAWVSAWEPLGGDRAHARDLAELVANLDFPEETTRLARLREQEHLNRRRAPPPLRNGHTTYEMRDTHDVVTSDFVRTPHPIESVQRMHRALNLRDSMPQNRVNLMFLLTQMPDPQAGYDAHFDADDERTVAMLRNFVDSDDRYAPPEEWKRFLAETLMRGGGRKGDSLRLGTGSASAQRALDDNDKISQHEALARALSTVDADVARMNSVDKMARLLTAYAHEWQEKWDVAFGSLGEDVERVVDRFRKHRPIVNDPEMEAVVGVAFSSAS